VGAIVLSIADDEERGSLSLTLAIEYFAGCLPFIYFHRL
jgi:hypothetical protein